MPTTTAETRCYAVSSTAGAATVAATWAASITASTAVRMTCERDCSVLIISATDTRIPGSWSASVVLPRTGLALAPDGQEHDKAYGVLPAGRKSSLRRLGT